MTITTVAPGTLPGVEDRRASRYAARHFLWEHSSLKRVQYCGRYAASDAGVGVRVSEGPEGRSAGFAGLQHCGSVWACPVCSAKIAATRQAEIESGLRAWHERGGRVGLVTQTMRHQQGQALSDLWDGVSDAWHASTSGRSWSADQRIFGVPMARTIRSGKRKGEAVIENRIRTIRVVEVTHGDNGWHVHIHALILFRGSATAAEADSDLQTIAAGMFGRWRSSLVGAGFDAPSDRHGMDATLLRGDPAKALGEYFTKAVYSAAAEATRGDLKDAKGGNSTPFGILRSLVTTGEVGTPVLDEAEAIRRRAIWAEWEAGSKGRRQIAWTVGLRAELLGQEDEQTDQEIADEDEGGETVGQIDRATVKAITRARADWAVLAAFGRDLAEGWALVGIFRARAEQAEANRTRGIDRMRLPRPDWRRR